LLVEDLFHTRECSAAGYGMNLLALRLRSCFLLTQNQCALFGGFRGFRLPFSFAFDFLGVSLNLSPTVFYS
jgi:hypothetical protein